MKMTVGSGTIGGWTNQEQISSKSEELSDQSELSEELDYGLGF